MLECLFSNLYDPESTNNCRKQIKVISEVIENSYFTNELISCNLTAPSIFLKLERACLCGQEQQKQTSSKFKSVLAYVVRIFPACT